MSKKINILKITNMLVNMCLTGRTSLLTLQVLLVINENPSIGKNQLKRLLRSNVKGKSFLDRPVEKLLEYNLIKSETFYNVATNMGEARVRYSISKNGKSKMLECCY